VSRAPRRGDVYWVNLDPVVGTEIRKTRPAVVVSNDSCNRYGARVVVLPVTSNVDSLYPGVRDPAAFLRTYAAAERAHGRPGPFSEKTWRVIDTLDAKYWRH